jgi:hypothetical protein
VARRRCRWKVNIKIIFRERIWGCGLNSPGSG